MPTPKLLCALACAAALLTPTTAEAATLTAQVAGTQATVREQQVGEVSYLFLPSPATPSSVSLSALDATGQPVDATLTLAHLAEPVTLDQPVDLTAAEVVGSEELGDTYVATLTAADEPAPREVRVKFSSSIRSLFIASEHGRAYIEADPNHNTKDSGTLTALTADGTPLYDGKLTQVKGRGNTTWNFSDKRPYQIKLGAKVDLVGGGDKSKTWVLLANAGDPTLLRNTVALNLARALGIPTASSNAPADLYYDGEYLGNYLVCEKVEVGPGRVDVRDLDDANDEANEGNPAWEDVTWADARNAFGRRFTYLKDAREPSDVSGGYLFEYDYHPSAKDVTFTTTFGDFTLKSPDPPTYAEAKYVSEVAETAFLHLLAGEDAGLDPLGNHFDLEELATLGWFEEFVGEGDYFFISSTNFALNAGSRVVHAVAPWDFDRSFWLEDAQNTHGFFAGALLGNPELQRLCARVQKNQLSALVRNVLLGEERTVSSNGALRSLASYEAEIRASRHMDETRWGLGPMRDEWITWDPAVDTTYQANYDKLAEYLRRRVAWCDAWVEQGEAGTWTPADGWVMRGNVRSYVRDGKLLRGWLDEGGTRYNLDPTYAITYRHWQADGNDWYLIRDDGTPSVGWAADGSLWYHFDDEGRMQRGWLDDGGSWYWLDDVGGWMRRGWIQDHGRWYFLDINTAHLLRNGWLEYDGNWYWLMSDGQMALGWRQVDGAWYWMGADGALKYGWQEINGERYYFDPVTGAMATGMRQVEGRWRWFTKEGVFLF